MTPTDPSAPLTGSPASENPQPPETQEQAQTEPKVVTQEDLAHFGEDLIRRMRQSDRDRSKRIEAELNAMRQQLTAAGVQVAPEQEQKLRETIEQKIDDPQQEETPASESTEQLHPAVAAALALMKDEGVTVQEGDPEFDQFIKPILTGPQINQAKLLAATTRAIDAKRARQASKQMTAALRSPSGSGSTSTGSPAAASARDYLKDAYKK